MLIISIYSVLLCHSQHEFLNQMNDIQFTTQLMRAKSNKRLCGKNIVIYLYISILENSKIPQNDKSWCHQKIYGLNKVFNPLVIATERTDI
jgi:hypothetical protein